MVIVLVLHFRYIGLEPKKIISKAFYIPDMFTLKNGIFIRFPLL